MQDDRLSIEELANAAGLTRRGVRFYVQQRLLPAPHGVGRGKHYDRSHLDRLRQIRELQAAGHSLDEIRHLVAGGGGTPSAPVVGANAEAVATPPRRRRALLAARPALRAELWRRLRVREGVELSFDAARFNPTVEQLVGLRDAIAAAFNPSEDDHDDDPSNGQRTTDNGPRTD